jgi:hypothetical protein
MARYSLDPNNLMVQSFVTGSETETGVGVETIAEEPVDGIRDTIYDRTCANTCGATCGRTCDGGLLCGFQSLAGYCQSEAKAC